VCLTSASAALRWRALATSLALSILFILVYGGCLWITVRRHDVGVFYFQWERAIPFVPWMILPYLSIDLFFFAAPFLFPNERELRLYAWRVAATIVIAGICFLIFPLRFAFPRPTATGWLGVLFDRFRALDAPHNLCPSLHAALLVLLVGAYARHLRRWRRALALGWLFLVGCSPLLTHQHHVIDIVAGFALAGFCCWLIRKDFPRFPHTRDGMIRGQDEL
jgi:membrane-associated phospholipid phosphatase